MEHSPNALGAIRYTENEDMVLMWLLLECFFVFPQGQNIWSVYVSDMCQLEIRIAAMLHGPQFILPTFEIHVLSYTISGVTNDLFIWYVKTSQLLGDWSRVG